MPTPPSSPPKRQSAHEALLMALSLAKFDLCLDIEPAQKGVYAELGGATFGYDRMLRDSGAHWDSKKEVWTFPSSVALRAFSEALNQTRDNSVTELAEDASPFSSSFDLDTTLGRLLSLGPNVLTNSDLLELLLSFDSYLPDPRAMSHRLMDEFGSLGSVLSSEAFAMSKFDDVTPRIRGLLQAVQLTIERVLHEPIQSNPVIGSWEALLDYLRVRLQNRKVEEMLALYLDRKHRLIKTESAEGSVSNAPFYPRKIASRALELFASGVIIAHNHPSGDVTPSRADHTLTIQLNTALKALDIVLHDHVIVGHLSYFTFKGEGII